MEIHVFAEKLRSFKELAVHYLLIVLGILTAMGLEQCNESRHHAQQAAAAEKAIVAELRDNLKTLSGTIETRQKTLDLLKAAQTRLGENTFAVPDLEVRAQAVRRDMESAEGDLGFTLSSLRRTEWESAIASQTLQYMDRAKVGAYTKAYTAMQDVSSVARQVVVNSRTTEQVMILDMYGRGESKDSLAFARAGREFLQVQQSLNRNDLLLANALREALGEPAPAPAASAASR